MDALFQDVRYAWRWLRKTPGFTALAVVCIGVGIGVNTTIFSCVYGVFFRPFGFNHPEHVVEINDHYQKGKQDNRYDLSYQNYLDWKRSASSYSDVAAYTGASMTLTDGEEPERLPGLSISHDLFPMLGVQPMLGRQFRADEDRVGAPGVVIISHDLWTTRYRSDPNILSRTIVVNDASRTVVGVMPPRFAFWNNHKLWVPIGPQFAARPRNERSIGVLARLKPGVTIEQARNEATVFAAGLARQFPNDNKGWTSQLRPFSEALVPNDIRLIVATMMGAVTFVLLIACSNVANLLLSRATTRAREIAIRSAIGAGRGRIVRQLLTESLLIGLMGGALGVLVAFWGCDLLWAAMPGEQRPPYYIYWAVDPPALIYTFVISLVTGVLFGLAPALETVRVNLHESLKEGSRGTGAGSRRGRVRNALVVAQVALSLVLLVGAALFVRSFLLLQTANPGFDTSPMMTMRFYLPGDRYENDRVRMRRVEDIVRRVETMPGVVAAAASNTILLENGGAEDGIRVEGRDIPQGEEPWVYFTGVTGHWLQTHGIPVSRGRTFTAAEASDSSGVTVVTQGFAKKVWPGQDAIGRRFSIVSDSLHQWIRVIGVVPDHRVNDMDEREPVAAAYLPYLYVSARNNALIVRAERNPVALANAIRREIRASDAGLPVFSVRSMEEVRRFSYWDKALFGKIFSVFGLVALVLAIVGVYGVIAYSVSQRTHEIGVRMALGADERSVLRLVVGQGFRLALWGIGFGVVGALGVTWVIRSQLFGVSPTDPMSFAGIAMLLTGVACLASWVPAQRAARVQPTVALREE